MSGGTVYNISTLSTGLATMGQPTTRAFLRRKPSKCWLECYGVLPTTPPASSSSPTGTTIVSISPDGLGMGNYTITMSADGRRPPGRRGKAGVGGSFAFVGSLYTSATTPTGQPAMTPGSIPMNSNIMTIDPAVGMYLRPE